MRASSRSSTSSSASKSSVTAAAAATFPFCPPNDSSAPSARLDIALSFISAPPLGTSARDTAIGKGTGAGGGSAACAAAGGGTSRRVPTCSTRRRPSASRPSSCFGSGCWSWRCGGRKSESAERDGVRGTSVGVSAVLSLNISCAPSSRREGTGGAGSVLSCAALLASASASASASFTRLRLRRLVCAANGSSSVVSFGEGSGFGDKSSTSNGGGETERAREVTRKWCDIHAASAP